MDDADETAFIMSTSGTTGPCKGMILSKCAKFYQCVIAHCPYMLLT